MRSILVAAFIIFAVPFINLCIDTGIGWLSPAFGEENQAQLDSNGTTPAATTESSQSRSSTSIGLPVDKSSGEAEQAEEAGTQKHSKKRSSRDSGKESDQVRAKSQEHETGNLHKVHMFLTGSNCYACLKELESKMKVLEGISEVKIERPSAVAYSSYGGEIQYPEGNIVYNPEKINIAQIASFMKTQGYYPYKIVDKLRK